MIQTKRAYDCAAMNDGYRVLVDRLWPRGESKVKEQLDDWIKEIAPSDELRKWFNHDLDRFPEFKRKYIDELNHNEKIVKQLRQLINSHEIVTFIYGAKDREHNNAVVLKEYIES